MEEQKRLENVCFQLNSYFGWTHNRSGPDIPGKKYRIMKGNKGPVLVAVINDCNNETLLEVMIASELLSNDYGIEVIEIAVVSSSVSSEVIASLNGDMVKQYLLYQDWDLTGHQLPLLLMSFDADNQTRPRLVLLRGGKGKKVTGESGKVPSH